MKNPCDDCKYYPYACINCNRKGKMIKVRKNGKQKL